MGVGSVDVIGAHDMAPTNITENREDFLKERALITGKSDSPVALDPNDDAEIIDAITTFARAADPERTRPVLRKPKPDGTLKDAPLNNATAADYLKCLRITHQRGFDLLTGTADEYNDFMADMVDGVLDTYDGSIARTTAGKYQSAIVAFYRFCAEPGVADDRPGTRIPWPAGDIHVFSDQSDPRHDEADMFDDDEVDALRESCLKSQNPRRDRALVEVLAGTCQRLTVVRTLRIKDVFVAPDEETPHILINPEIAGDGDKGAIEHADRWRPIVSDTGPVREWIRHHPLRDADVRDEHGAPDDFEDCYLFIGDVSVASTDASRPWSESAVWDMLRRRKDTTERMPGVTTVTKPVNAHNFRHYAYSKSKELPIDEDARRKVFGWSPGSDTGDTVYGHVGAEKSGRQFAEEWVEKFGDGSGTAGVAKQVVGAAATGDLSEEATRALVEHIATNDEAMARLADAIATAAD